MSKKLVLLHTVASLAAPFDELAKEVLPEDVRVLHVADEMLLDVVLAEGGVSPFIYRRVSDHVLAAERFGADAVMLTCSSISPAIEAAALMVDIPVLRVDEAMADRAIALGRRVGVVATAPTTLGPTTDLVYARAKAKGCEVTVDAVLCEGAYDALFAGDTETHDRIVRDTLKVLMARDDVVALAQASMARVADAIPQEERIVPILASPRLGLERAREVLA